MIEFAAGGVGLALIQVELLDEAEDVALALLQEVFEVDAAGGPALVFFIDDAGADEGFVNLRV